MKTNVILFLLFGILIHPLAAAVNGFRLTASYDPSNKVLTISATNLETSLFILERSADLGGPWTRIAANLAPAQRFDFVETNLVAAARRFFRGRLASAYVPGELLVLFRRGVTEGQRDSVLQSVGATNRETILTRPMQANGLEPIFRALTTNNVLSTVQNLRAKPEVDHAEPVWLARLAAAADDRCYKNGEQWGLYAPDTVPSSAFGSKAAKAWAAGFTGSPSVCVGVIDTGIQISHPDLAPNIWTNLRETPNDTFDSDANGFPDDDHGWDFVHSDRTVDDGITATSPLGERHGTKVAGIIGAVGGNGQDIAGVNWSVSLIPVKVCENDGTGIRVDNAIKALDYLTQLKANGAPIAVINASWGFDSYGALLHEALLRAARADILIVAAVGNDGQNIDLTPVYPACSDTSVRAALSSGGTNQAPATSNAVIAVAAIQSDGFLSSGVFDSNYGVTNTALGAPGTFVTSTVPYFGPGSNSTGKDNGTSFAAAFVSGAVALYKSTHCTATAPQIKQALLGAAAQTPSLMGKIFGERRLDLSTVISPGSLLCPDVWVDIAYTGPCPDGTSTRPFRMIVQSHQAAMACTTTIHIRTGAYPELPLLLDKPVLFVPEGGPVSIGP